MCHGRAWCAFLRGSELATAAPSTVALPIAEVGRRLLIRKGDFHHAFPMVIGRDGALVELPARAVKFIRRSRPPKKQAAFFMVHSESFEDPRHSVYQRLVLVNLHARARRADARTTGVGVMRFTARAPSGDVWLHAEESPLQVLELRRGGDALTMPWWSSG